MSSTMMHFIDDETRKRNKQVHDVDVQFSVLNENAKQRETTTERTRHDNVSRHRQRTETHVNDTRSTDFASLIRQMIFNQFLVWCLSLSTTTTTSFVCLEKKMPNRKLNHMFCLSAPKWNSILEREHVLVINCTHKPTCFLFVLLVLCFVYFAW